MGIRIEKLSAFDRGFYNHEGFSRPSLERYFLRWDDNTTPSERTRSFYAFDLSGLTFGEDHVIVDVRMSLFLPPDGYRGPNPAERISTHIVRSDIVDRVLAGGQQGPEIFGMLGDGPCVGESVVTDADEGKAIRISFIDDMRTIVAQLYRSTDKRLMLGGRLVPFGPRRGDRNLFRLTDGADPVVLEVEIEEF